ncbi:MAG: ROK family protein [Clostridia bacterium]|nr:ROK family protein [Clostridia bacterium]
MKYYLGIDIGGTKCAVIHGDGDGHVLSKRRFPTTDCTQTVAAILDTARDMIAEAKRAGQPVSAVGISCGSPMDSRRGIIKEPPNLPGWVDVPITRLVTEATGLPAYLCNDANACALAEWQYGAGRGTRNMIFLTFGTGMGAGLILDGRLYAGTNDNAGEVGHIRLSDSESAPVGYHKAGSFEGFCSGGGLAQLGQIFAVKAIADGCSPAYCPDKTSLPSVTAKSVADAAHAGDPTAIEVYRACGRRLGQALSVLVDLFNPERIVIGSVFARSGDLLIPEMRRVMEAECLPDALAACEVVPAALTESVGDLAALTVAVINGK